MNQIRARSYGALAVVCTAVLSSLSAAAATKPTVTTVYPFPKSQAGAPLYVQQGGDGNFYGTTPVGGSDGVGLVYEVTPQGVETVLNNFGSTTKDYNGQVPLVRASDGSIYGSTSGYENAAGTIFRVANGSYSIAHDFTGSDVSWASDLVAGPNGTVCGIDQLSTAAAMFCMTASGTVTQLYTFPDNVFPGSLVLGSDGNFYGLSTPFSGGAPETFFKVSPGGQYTQLSTDVTQTIPIIDYLSSGPDGNLYGVSAEHGTGTHGTGAISRLTPTGQLSVVHDFSADKLRVENGIYAANVGGAGPAGPLTVGSDGNLYGTTSAGGTGGAGVFFRMTTGGQVTTLYNFPLLKSSSVKAPQGSAMQGNDGSFYGVGGLGTSDAIYKINIGLSAP